MRKNPESGLQIVIKHLGEVLGPLPYKGPASEVPLNPVISHATGVPLNIVQSAVGFCRSNDLLPHPDSAEESKIRLSRSKSFNPQLEEEWGWISGYADLGMSPREIHQALIMEQGVDINLHTLRQRIHGQTKRGNFERQDEGYESDMRKTVLSATDEEIRGRVRLWLDVKRTLVRQGEILPATRREWMVLIRLEQEKMIDEVNIILGRKELADLNSTPQTAYEWRLLTRLLKARRAIQQSGIKSFESEELNSLAEELGRLPADRFEALKPYSAAIIKATPIQNGSPIH